MVGEKLQEGISNNYIRNSPRFTCKKKATVLKTPKIKSLCTPFPVI